MSDYTIRELVASTLSADPDLADMGLKSVWDADTVDAPATMDYPFAVVRWSEQTDFLAHVLRRRFDVWIYGRGEDRTPYEKLSTACFGKLVALEPQPKYGGFLVQIEDRGPGADLWDDAYQAMVVPHQGLAVYSGT